jgi:hypothetical protein
MIVGCFAQFTMDNVRVQFPSFGGRTVKLYDFEIASLCSQRTVSKSKFFCKKVIVIRHVIFDNSIDLLQ